MINKKGLGFCNRVNNHLVSRGIHGHRLLDEPIEEFASAFGFAAVETKGKTDINSDADCLCRLTTVT